MSPKPKPVNPKKQGKKNKFKSWFGTEHRLSALVGRLSKQSLQIKLERTKATIGMLQARVSALSKRKDKDGIKSFTANRARLRRAILDKGILDDALKKM